MIESSPGDEASASSARPWVYHLLVVDYIKSKFQTRPGKLGYMFDFGSDDPDDPPRQGAAVAAKERIDESGTELQASGAFFYWTALHELGHMQGLYHNPDDRGLMQPRVYRDGQFDPARDLRHAGSDLHRLRHLPDLWVRPGGVPGARSDR